MNYKAEELFLKCTQRSWHSLSGQGVQWQLCFVTILQVAPDDTDENERRRCGSIRKVDWFWQELVEFVEVSQQNTVEEAIPEDPAKKRVADSCWVLWNVKWSQEGKLKGDPIYRNQWQDRCPLGTNDIVGAVQKKTVSWTLASWDNYHHTWSCGFGNNLEWA